MLEKILIGNFLSISSNQELKVSNRITTLIGKNAVGKTSILKAINKLNGEVVSTKEKNINHRDEPTTIHAKFRLTKEFIKELNSNYKKSNQEAILSLPESKELFYDLFLSDNGTINYSLTYASDNSEFDLSTAMNNNVIKIVNK